jgi:hypothetical protein
VFCFPFPLSLLIFPSLSHPLFVCFRCLCCHLPAASHRPSCTKYVIKPLRVLRDLFLSFYAPFPITKYAQPLKRVLRAATSSSHIATITSSHNARSAFM